MGRACVYWAGILNPVGGETTWINGRPNLQGVGGTSFAVDGLFPGVPLFLTVQGAACGLRPALTAATLKGPVPDGFFPGWPNDNLAADEFNPATLQGDAELISPAEVGFPSAPGMVQGYTGWRGGAFYFEYFTAYNLFSTGLGAGVGRAGVQLSNWFGGGGFNNSDPNGGAGTSNGNNGQTPSYQPSVFANTAIVSHPEYTTYYQTMAAAILITPESPFGVFRPSSIEPVAMSCVPCAPLVLAGGWPGRYA